MEKWGPYLSERQWGTVRPKDLLSSACYIRKGNELLECGLYLDLPPWSCHVFNLEVNP